MGEWIEKTLGEITSYLAKGIPPKYAENFMDDTIYVLNQKCNRNYVISYEAARIHDIKKKKVASEKMLRPGDVLINSTGEGTAGRVAQIWDIPAPTTTDGHMITLRPTAEVDALYYGYVIKSHQKYIETLAEGSTGQTEINRQRLQDEVVVCFPKSKEEQKIIASIFDRIDRKIENNHKINRNLEEQALLLFKSWFLDYEPYSNVKPETWEDGVLGDFVTIKRGGSPRPIQEYLTDKGLRWLKISDVTSLSSPFVIDIAECIKESGLKKTVFLKAGSLVLSNSATPGVPKILDVDSCIHDGWLYFTESQFSNEFLYLYFKHIRRNLVALGNGSVFTNLKTDILKGYPTVKPERNVLEEFDSIVFPMFEEMRRIARENHKLSELRDSLLPRLMSGELDVSDLDI